MSNPEPIRGEDPTVMEGLVNPSNVNFAGRPTTILPTVIPLERPPVPVETHRDASLGWGGALVVACLILGVLGSLVQYERSELRSEQARAAGFQTEDSLMEARSEDLGRFLAQPQTRLIRLTGTDASSDVEAALALNPAKPMGYFLCDQLQALDHGSHYEIWTRSGAEEARQMGGIDARPGVSVYPFKADLDLKGANRVEITAGPRSAGNGPIFVGEMD
jgi:hypothetical protein